MNDIMIIHTSYGKSEIVVDIPSNSEIEKDQSGVSVQTYPKLEAAACEARDQQPLFVVLEVARLDFNDHQLRYPSFTLTTTESLIDTFNIVKSTKIRRAMLDSSPVALPPTRRPLKRSASTASLPTPPRTHRKFARGRSRGSCDSDSDDHAVLSSDEEEIVRHKKRRTGKEAEADEEAFWLGGASDSKTSETGTASDAKKDAASSSKSQAAPLLYRRSQPQQSKADVAPVSPPPSRRKTAVTSSKLTLVAQDSSATVSPPSTPRTRLAVKRASAALRDSPDNPFLATPENHVEDSATPSPNASSANPSPRTPVYEKPTITYVFRGVRRVYQNPLYNHAKDRPYSPPPASKLPIDDPDFSPAMHCTPKLLFPEARHKKGKKVAPKAAPTKSRKRSPSLSEDDGDADEAAAIRPTKLNFGEPSKTKSKQGSAETNVQTLDLEFKTAGEPLSG
ncbi:unnamed protein product [Cyclocybe aegerita]|uniref:Uncharacterized protein n=1 Tax=Cyclocybe aegerita TaxID=1973307 RepID=A0A8S0W3E7_CYCAE|nr:unnamed protein product [Cyclocybe aegerita]